MSTKKPIKIYKKPVLEVKEFNKFFLTCCATPPNTISSTKSNITAGSCKCTKKALPFLKIK